MTTNRKLFCCMYQRTKYRTFMKRYDLVKKLSVKTNKIFSMKDTCSVKQTDTETIDNCIVRLSK